MLTACDLSNHFSILTRHFIRGTKRCVGIRGVCKACFISMIKADIDQGLADVAAGRVKDFDKKRIVERGRKLLATRSSSD